MADIDDEITIIPISSSDIETEAEELFFLTDEELAEKRNEEAVREAEKTKSEEKVTSSNNKPVITYRPAKDEKCIRIKYKDGVRHSFEVTINFKRKEVYDENEKAFVKKNVQQRKSFENLDDAIIWRNEHQNEKIDSKKRNREYIKYGATMIDAAEAYYAEMEGMVSQGKKTESYLNQLRIQTDHFRRFFNGERTTYVRQIDVKQIEEYFNFEEKKGACRASIEKYKSHLKAIWIFMMKDKATYGVNENVVAPAQITTPETEYKAVALNYKQINELIVEACQLEDPTFLYMVVFSMMQGLRRGEMCGLMWKDINFETKKIQICHNRIQLVTSDITKLPKRDKIREIEMHQAGYDTLVLYKEWQESILGRKVRQDEYVMQWEINLIQNYVCHTGKVSRKWKEIYAQINKCRVKAGKDKIPYGRIHDGRHTYITLSLQGIKKDDGTIIPPASYFQVFQSAGHSLPKSMQNTSTTVYNEDVGDRWDVTRFWNQAITINIANEWRCFEESRKVEYESLTQFEKDKRAAQKQNRLEKAKQERLTGNPPEDVLLEYTE